MTRFSANALLIVLVAVLLGVLIHPAFFLLLLALIFLA